LASSITNNSNKKLAFQLAIDVCALVDEDGTESLRFAVANLWSKLITDPESMRIASLLFAQSLDALRLCCTDVFELIEQDLRFRDVIPFLIRYGDESELQSLVNPDPSATFQPTLRQRETLSKLFFKAA
jgi:hypothetical protein